MNSLHISFALTAPHGDLSIPFGRNVTNSSDIRIRRYLNTFSSDEMLLLTDLDEGVWITK